MKIALAVKMFVRELFGGFPGLIAPILLSILRTLFVIDYKEKGHLDRKFPQFCVMQFRRREELRNGCDDCA
jgi:hypothetical protein